MRLENRLSRMDTLVSAVCLSVLPALLMMGMAGCRATLPAPVVVPSPAPAIQSRLPVIEFTIQVGAFSTPERAARYEQVMEAHGLDAYYFIDTDGLCKVRFERFATKAVARQRANALQARGVIDAFYIVQPGLDHGRDPLKARLRQNLVNTARRFIGTPYRWGGESARDGFDCSGLTMTVYRLNGLELPRNSRAQFDAGSAISKNDLQVGDLVFFATGRRGRVSHVGVYSGRGQFIHAPGRGKRIRTALLSKSYFKSRYMGARRYF